MLSSLWKLIGVTLFALTAIAGIAMAQNSPTQQPPVIKTDLRVRAMMDEMVNAYKAQTNLQEKVTFKFFANVPELIPENIPVEFNLKLQKPNKVNLSWTEKGKSGLVKKRLISDGIIQSDVYVDSNSYYQTKAPMALPAPPIVLNVPEFDLLFNGRDPFTTLRIPTQYLKIGESEKFNDVDCDVLIGTVSQPAINLTATLRLGMGKKDHLIRGMIFEGAGTSEGKAIKFKYEAIYDLTLSPNLTDSDFKFMPPPDSKLLTAPKKQ